MLTGRVMCQEVTSMDVMTERNGREYLPYLIARESWWFCNEPILECLRWRSRRGCPDGFVS